jgi:hypothetical protein
MKDSTIIIRRPGYVLNRRELQIQVNSAKSNSDRKILDLLRHEINDGQDPVKKACAVEELHTIALHYENYIENLAEYILNLEVKLEAKRPKET